MTMATEDVRRDGCQQLILLVWLVGMRLFTAWWHSWDKAHELYFGVLDCFFLVALILAWIAVGKLEKV